MPSPAPNEALTDRELEILDLETRWFKHDGRKVDEIRRRFGWTSTVYYNRLNALIDRPEAEAARPVLVHRLRRLRDARREARSAQDARNRPA